VTVGRDQPTLQGRSSPIGDFDRLRSRRGKSITRSEGNIITRMTQEGALSAPERIIGEVIDCLETGGLEAVVLREIARAARVSLRDVYQHFGSRDELIVAAVGQWMDTNVYKPMAERAADASLFDALMRQFRHVFEPWEQNPRLLDAFVYARSTRSGDRLLRQGEEAAGPTFAPLIEDLIPATPTTSC